MTHEAGAGMHIVDGNPNELPSLRYVDVRFDAHFAYDVRSKVSYEWVGSDEMNPWQPNYRVRYTAGKLYVNDEEVAFTAVGDQELATRTTSDSVYISISRGNEIALPKLSGAGQSSGSGRGLYVMTMEENGGLDPNKYQFSYGNGSNGRYIGGYVPVDMRVEALALISDSNMDGAQVELHYTTPDRNTVETGVAAVGDATTNIVVTPATDFTVPGGSFVNLFTRSGNSGRDIVATIVLSYPLSGGGSSEAYNDQELKDTTAALRGDITIIQGQLIDLDQIKLSRATLTDSLGPLRATLAQHRNDIDVLLSRTPYDDQELRDSLIRIRADLNALMDEVAQGDNVELAAIYNSIDSVGALIPDHPYVVDESQGYLNFGSSQAYSNSEGAIVGLNLFDYSAGFQKTNTLGFNIFNKEALASVNRSNYIGSNLLFPQDEVNQFFLINQNIIGSDISLSRVSNFGVSYLNNINIVGNQISNGGFNHLNIIAENTTSARQDYHSIFGSEQSRLFSSGKFNLNTEQDYQQGDILTYDASTNRFVRATASSNVTNDGVVTNATFSGSGSNRTLTIERSVGSDIVAPLNLSDLTGGAAYNDQELRDSLASHLAWLLHLESTYSDEDIDDAIAAAEQRAKVYADNVSTDDQTASEVPSRGSNVEVRLDSLASAVDYLSSPFRSPLVIDWAMENFTLDDAYTNWPTAAAGSQLLVKDGSCLVSQYTLYKGVWRLIGPIHPTYIQQSATLAGGAEEYVFTVRYHANYQPTPVVVSRSNSNYQLSFSQTNISSSGQDNYVELIVTALYSDNAGGAVQPPLDFDATVRLDFCGGQTATLSLFATQAPTQGQSNFSVSTSIPQ